MASTLRQDMPSRLTVAGKQEQHRANRSNIGQTGATPSPGSLKAVGVEAGRRAEAGILRLRLRMTRGGYVVRELAQFFLVGWGIRGKLSGGARAWAGVFNVSFTTQFDNRI